MNEQELYERAVFLGPNEAPRMGQPYVISDDPRRGMRTIGLFHGTKHSVYNIQMLPDNYLDLVKQQREANAAMSATRRNAQLAQPFINLPHAVAQNLMSKDGDGRAMLDPRDIDERDKRLKRIANDLDNRDLRTREGKV